MSESYLHVMQWNLQYTVKKMNILVGHYRTTKPQSLRIKRYRIQGNTEKISLSLAKNLIAILQDSFPKKTKTNKKQT